MKEVVSVKVSLIEDLHFRGFNEQEIETDMDVKHSDYKSSGPTPVELLLQAMGGCTSVDVVSILRKRKVEIDKYEVLIKGTKRETHPKMYETITITYRVKAENLTLTELEKAVRLSMDNYCSISSALKKTAEISWNCELIE